MLNENQMCSLEEIFLDLEYTKTIYNVISDNNTGLNTTINIHLGWIKTETVYEGRQKNKNLPFPGIPIWFICWTCRRT